MRDDHETERDHEMIKRKRKKKYLKIMLEFSRLAGNQGSQSDLVNLKWNWKFKIIEENSIKEKKRKTGNWEVVKPNCVGCWLFQLIKTKILLSLIFNFTLNVTTICESVCLNILFFFLQ